MSTKEEPKQWIVMRTDLNMRKGKMVAQGAHASMRVLLGMAITDHNSLFSDTAYSWRIQTDDDILYNWIEGAFTKICVRVGSEEGLIDIYAKAVEARLPCSLITDQGRTEFGGIPTKTCCAIGPCLPSEAQDIVGGLKLL